LLLEPVRAVLDNARTSADSTTVGDRFLYHISILSPLTFVPPPLIL